MTEFTVPPTVIENYRQKFHAELYENVLPFWMKNSLDHEYGGYFNCLDRDGSVYDTRKHIWLQGREVWMMSKIHNTVGEKGGTSPFLEAATLGANFLRKHARTKENRVYFSLTREGKPHFMQRKMFSECFYVMAMAEYARAMGDASARKEARTLFDAVLKYAKDPSLLGKPVYKGGKATSELAVPMILLNLVEELRDPGEQIYQDVEKWCVKRIDLHYRPDLKLVLETVGADGELLDTPEGRLVNPGHAIECGWFLLSYAQRSKNAALATKALNMIDWSYDYGLDREFGGIYYFLDRTGRSPLQLEWQTKLWWPHCEAMVAFIMAYQHTGDPRYFTLFEEVMDYSFNHFKDPRFGEWFGYLDRRGDVSQRFKGGPYKGCFHVPRSLFLVEKVLREIQLADGIPH
jgi:N-acylglucosamine 2-epimerase